LAKLSLIETCGADNVASMCRDVIRNATKNEIKFKSSMSRGDFAILGNVHKSKGLEFSNVMLADDFVNLCDPQIRNNILRSEREEGLVDEFNMIYVAVTRARQRLRLNEKLRILLCRHDVLTIPVLREVQGDKNVRCAFCRGGRCRGMVMVVDFDKYLCGDCAWERFPFLDGFYR